MHLEQIIQRMQLEPQHFQSKSLKTLVVEPGVYNLLGKRLFDIYQKYQIPEPEQREVENLCYLMVNFTLSREAQQEDFRLKNAWNWRKLFSRGRSLSK